MDKYRVLSKFLNEDVSVEHFNGCPAFIEMTQIGFTSALYDPPFFSYGVSLTYFKKREGDYMTLVSDQQKIGKNLIDQFRKNPNIVFDLYRCWLKNFQIMMEFYYSFFDKDLKSLSNRDLIGWSETLYDFYKNKISMPGFIDGFMFYADKRLDNLLKDFCQKNNISDYQKIFSILPAPLEKSFINEEESNLIKLVAKIKKADYKGNKNLKKFIKEINNSRLSKQIQNHLFKYSWVKSSYLGYKEYAWNNLENEIMNLLKSDKKNSAGINHNKINKEKLQLIKKYKFTPEILAISKLSEVLTKWQDQRKIYTLTFCTLKEKILKEVSLRSKIGMELLRYSETLEIPLLLKGSLKNELKKRRLGSIFVFKNGKRENIICGKKAKDLFAKINRPQVSIGANELTGMVASGGKARGVVKIVTAIKELSKVKNGDILVAPMTRPEHLPGMKKAAAFITDDGGITCHAAIIAREMNKPCIIGTKIATKILKDGDSVEVNADKGIVKILKTA